MLATNAARAVTAQTDIRPIRAQLRPARTASARAASTKAATASPAASTTVTWARSSLGEAEVREEGRVARRREQHDEQGGVCHGPNEGDRRAGDRGRRAGRAGLRRLRRRARCGDGSQVEHRQVAVGADAVPAAVARVVAGGELLEHVDPRPRLRRRHRRHDEVPLDVDVLLDLVGDLQREEREADAAVVRRGGQPVDGEATRQQPALGAAPEAHVVATCRRAGDLALVGEVLAPVEEVQRADRCGGVAPTAQRAPHDGRPAAQVEPVRARPPAAVIAACSWAAVPRSATFTGSPSRPSLVRVRPMK